ncbi:MAG: YdiU family protein [Burkholderiales bacterium]|nr:YdiU family protein [Burkholderiales bacterium]
MPQFDNRFLRLFPGEANPSRHSRQVHGALYTLTPPTPVAAPRLLAESREVKALLGLEGVDLSVDPWLSALSGNGLIEGMQTYATAYGGHQFGQWAGQLGDGRALMLGELLAPDGQRWELQLKGAGPTPFARRADGRAVLRSSIREFLCSEAMHHLGVPTTRALSLVATGELVERDMFYDGHPALEPGAIVCRVAPSFLRFGHFELLASRGETELLARLVDYVIEAFYPEVEGTGHERTAAWFGEVCARTARLIAEWMRVGFVHGVMNTDNMSILGLTIDYGPYGWVDHYDPAWTPNTTDAQGRRYCFGRQPAIAHWNLARLGDALATLGVPVEALERGLARYGEVYAEALERTLALKLGFPEPSAESTALAEALFAWMGQSEVDYTLFFRDLAQAEAPEDLRHAFYSQAAWAGAEGACRAWFARWRDAVHALGESPEVRQARMNAVNPRFVLRNYLAQQAIDAATAGDPSLVHELLETMRRPYDEQPGREHFAEKRPEWARHKPGCSMLSCSS